ncbi:hypothetical protein EVAR_8604_1 [Eumeta japonica]|uniref:Uncharacterized protein n=1 Tax=Eumeta variegata TaxID=151549 RepID=A0A4C1XJ87_EUMVA|nr:hypothetical protein EVAR_8604_1 [Eumeta japonica]
MFGNTYARRAACVCPRGHQPRPQQHYELPELPVNRAAALLTLTAILHLSSHSGSKSNTRWILFAARSAVRKDTKYVLSSAYSASITSFSKSSRRCRSVRMSSVCSAYSSRDRQLLCGTPACIGHGADSTSSMLHR